MSENIAFLFDNAADSATLVASSESGQMPASNLLLPERWKVWRSAASEVYATLDFTLPPTLSTAVAAVGLYDHNITPAGSIQVQAWTDAINGSNEVVNETIIPWANWHGYGGAGYGAGGYGGAPDEIVRSLFAPLSVVILSNYHDPATVPYWRLTVSDASLSYLQAARPYIGHVWQPSVNFDWGNQLEFIDRNKPLDAFGGQEYVNPVDEARAFNFDLSWLPPDERDTLIVQRKWHGSHKPFFVIPRHVDDSDQIIYSMYAKFKSYGLGARFARTSAASFRVEEVL